MTTSEESKATQAIGDTPDPATSTGKDQSDQKVATVKEIGGRDGLDPTRYGDWEKNGRCIDF